MSSLKRSLSGLSKLLCSNITFVKTHFLSSAGYSDGYQLKTSLNTPIKDDLDRRWLGAFVSSEADIVYKLESGTEQTFSLREWYDSGRPLTIKFYAGTRTSKSHPRAINPGLEA